jgi:type VI secretion system protein ImpL
MDQFQRAQAIRNAFFPDGGASPTVKFSLTPTFLDPKALRVMFEIDSTRLIYRHEAPRTRDLQWPNQADASTVAVTLTDVDNKSSKIMRSGSWAWFRLLDDAGLAPTTAPDKYTFTVQSESGIKAIYELQANSVTNPFNLPQLKEFRCPAAL